MLMVNFGMAQEGLQKAKIDTSNALQQQHVPNKLVLLQKMDANSDLHNTGLSLGAWGQLRFWALCPPPVQ